MKYLFFIYLIFTPAQVFAEDIYRDLVVHGNSATVSFEYDLPPSDLLLGIRAFDGYSGYAYSTRFVTGQCDLVAVDENETVNYFFYLTYFGRMVYAPEYLKPTQKAKVSCKLEIKNESSFSSNQIDHVYNNTKILESQWSRDSGAFGAPFTLYVTGIIPPTPSCQVYVSAPLIYVGTKEDIISGRDEVQTTVSYNCIGTATARVSFLPGSEGKLTSSSCLALSNPDNDGVLRTCFTLDDQPLNLLNEDKTVSAKEEVSSMTVKMKLSAEDVKVGNYTGSIFVTISPD